MSPNHLTPWVSPRTPGLFKAQDIYLDPPIRLRSTSRVIRFLVCAMLSQLTPERRQELAEDSLEDVDNYFCEVAFPFKTAEILFGKKDWDRLSGQVLAAAFDAASFECTDVTFRYAFFTSLLEGGFRCLEPDCNGFVAPSICSYAFSPKLMQRWTDTKPTADRELPPQSIVKLTADTVFNSMTCIAEAALELVRREMADGFQDFFGLSIPDIRQEFQRMVLSAQTVENSVGSKIPTACPLCGAKNAGKHSADNSEKLQKTKNPKPDWQCGVCGLKFWLDSSVPGISPSPAYF